MKIKDECVFSALEDRSRRMVTAERHDKWRVFHQTARSSGRGARSPQRHRQVGIITDFRRRPANRADDGTHTALAEADDGGGAA